MNNHLNKLVGQAMEIAAPNKDIQVLMQDVMPIVDGKQVAYCPEAAPSEFREKRPGGSILITRLLHPCKKECQLYSTVKLEKGLNPCTLSQE